MKVAVVGATGMVGNVLLQVLAERNFPITELLLVASERSVGKQLEFKGKQYTVIGLQDAVNAKPDIALFSAGGSTSELWAPKFAEVGCTVVDNSSAWRMDPTKKLVVPEINGNVLTKEDKIIANPNCSTAQLLMALKPIHDELNIELMNVATYQAVSGTGKAALEELHNQTYFSDSSGPPSVYPKQIAFNVIPQCDVFLDNDFTKEEMKLSNENELRVLIEKDFVCLYKTHKDQSDNYPNPKADQF